MKKLILSLFAVMIVTVTFSQVKVRPGFRAGLNMSKITHDQNVSYKTGINASMFVNVHLSRFYELQPEFTYSNQGWSHNGYNYIEPYNNTPINVTSHDINTNYIGFAITNKFFVAPNMGLHILMGPGMEINISDDFNSDSLTPIDMVLFVGIGYEFPFGLGLEARYKQGLIDVDENYAYYDSYNNNYYYDYNYVDKNKLNSVFQFSVYYKFAW